LHIKVYTIQSKFSNTAQVDLVFEKGDKSDYSNYRTIVLKNFLKKSYTLYQTCSPHAA